MNLYDDPSSERVTLERLKIGATQHVSRYILENAELDTWVDQFTRDMVLRFRSEVLAKTLGTDTAYETVVVPEPASWWQMFKDTYAQSWWLAWFVTRRPVVRKPRVVTVSVDVSTVAVFPDAALRFPKELGNPVIVNRVV